MSRALSALTLLLIPWATPTPLFAQLQAGYAHVDITPDPAASPVWIAGYGHNRRATAVHDPLFARAIVLTDGQNKIAIVAVDLIGLMRPAVLQARSQLPGVHLLVCSTHSHEGPDVLGLWGPTPTVTGVNDVYLQQVVAGIVLAVRTAEKTRAPVTAEFGTADDANLLGDSRLPRVVDPTLRVLKLARTPGADGAPIMLVQWNCHPETMGSKNTLLTADFPAATIAALQERHHADVVFVSGAIGGLMSPPEERFKTPTGQPYREGTWEWMNFYGRAVADLADRALAAAKPLQPATLAVQSREVYLPLANPAYRIASSLGVIKRQAFTWAGNSKTPGPPITGSSFDAPAAIQTEVNLITLGPLHIAALPGEIYPELIYGQYQSPVEPNTDFPLAPLETPVTKLLPPGPQMIIGLANDEIGYIIPKRQWDIAPPYAYNRDAPQYGEINSLGPDTAPLLLEALRDAVTNPK